MPHPMVSTGCPASTVPSTLSHILFLSMETYSVEHRPAPNISQYAGNLQTTSPSSHQHRTAAHQRSRGPSVFGLGAPFVSKSIWIFHPWGFILFFSSKLSPWPAHHTHLSEASDPFSLAAFSSSCHIYCTVSILRIPLLLSFYDGHLWHLS